MKNLAKKFRNTMIAANSLYISSVLAMPTAFATADANGDLGQWKDAATNIESLMSTLQNALLKVATPIAGVALIFCFIMTLVSQNQRTVEQYKNWRNNIIVCMVLIYAVSFILTLAQNLGNSFSGSSTSASSK